MDDLTVTDSNTLKDVRKSKIELAGEVVMNHILELAKTTDLSLKSIAHKINKTYSELDLNLTAMDISRFFKKNSAYVNELIADKRALGYIRANLALEHNSEMAKDIKTLNSQIESILGDDGQFLELDKKSTILANLIDKKGMLLMRYARISGKLDAKSTNINRMQVNVFSQVQDEKSEIIQKLKKFAPQTEELIVNANVITDKQDDDDDLEELEEYDADIDE